MKKDSISIKDMEPFFLYLPTDGGWNFCTVMEWVLLSKGWYCISFCRLTIK